ncbi:hypothetical protein WG66_016418 [Moniliophthora roreri]|nr:hypothetical protein WG66_016418 [Moniliophthora roreri]
MTGRGLSIVGSLLVKRLPNPDCSILLLGGTRPTDVQNFPQLVSTLPPQLDPTYVAYRKTLNLKTSDASSFLDFAALVAPGDQLRAFRDDDGQTLPLPIHTFDGR